MKTIKLPIQNEIDTSDIRRVFSSCVRFSYNRHVGGMEQKGIRHLIKERDLFSILPAHIIQCAILEGKYIHTKNKNKNKNKKVLFGGKRNLNLYLRSKITKKEFKENRLHPLTLQGEAHLEGNRNFKFDIMNGKIVFKFKRGQHFDIVLPNLRKKLHMELLGLQTAMEEHKLPVMVKLTKTHVLISYDELITNDFSRNKPTVKNRILGVDCNPNYVGLSVIEFIDGAEFRILHKEVVDMKGLNKPLGVKSSDPKQIAQNNKARFEAIEVAKHVAAVARAFSVSKVIVEDLSIAPSDKGKGRRLNRLCNNQWQRSRLLQNLESRVWMQGMEFVKVNAAYSSTIGNVLHGNDTTPDMVAASIEIARRGYKKFEKGWFYPPLPRNEGAHELWKQTVNLSACRDWKEFHLVVKSVGLKYRAPLDVDKASRVSSLSCIKSCINLYNFI